VGNLLEKLDGLRLPEGLEVAFLGAVLHGLGNARQLDALLGRRPLGGKAVPQGAADLRRHLVVQAGDEGAHKEGDGAERKMTRGTQGLAVGQHTHASDGRV
ncbi:MAG: hypothetical protein ACK55I_38790, partial [bacterium]